MPESPISDFLGRLRSEILPRDEGGVATYIPELAHTDPDLFGIAVATMDGTVYDAGDGARPFTIQSVSKPFVMALALQDLGVDRFLARVGVEPTGDPFNAVTLEPDSGRPLNPMVNAGAIVTSTLVDGDDADARTERIRAGLSAFAGRPLELDEEVLGSELATADRNRAIAYLMRSMGALDVDVEDALAAYCRQCSFLVTARDLAVMGATLASGGQNPVTGESVVRPEVVTSVLSVMVTCGLYDYSGEWMFGTGLPAKSGVGGGITAVLPGQLGVGTFSPRLDAQGNSVRGVLACQELSTRWGLHVMRPHGVSAPVLHRRLEGARVRSRRARPTAERSVLADGPEAVVYELQGDLAFKESEHVSRRTESESCRWLILDAARVDRIDTVAERLLGAAITALEERGVAVLLSGPWPDRLRESTRSAGELSDAVEECEETLVREAGLPSAEESMSLSANDLCSEMTPEQVAVLEGLGARLHVAAGEDLPDHDGLLLITRGLVDVSVPVEPPGPGTAEGRRIMTRSAGTAAGSASATPAPAGLRLRARTDVEVTAFPDRALAELTSGHPALAAQLYRNLAIAAAAEYRWVAADHAAGTV